MTNRKALPTLLLLLAAVVAFTGCSGKSKKWHFADWRPHKFWGKSEKPDPEVPERLVATWVDATLTKAGEIPKRGFGGRIVFFGEEGEDPVRVEGQLVVYAFDETDRPAHETQPTRRFIFPKEQFALLESESKLGASYSVWLPWDDIGGPMKKVSLIARFEPEDGPVVLGEQTRHMLPGALPSQQQLAATAPPSQAVTTPAVQLAGYNNPNPLAVSLPSSPQSNSSGSLPSAGRAGEGGSQPEVSVLTAPRMNPATPLAQMSTMTIQLPRRLGAPPAMPQRAAGFIPAERAAAASSAASALQPNASAASTAPTQPPAPSTSPRPQTPSLRNSLLSTLPARVVPAAQPAPGRAR